MGIRNLLLVKSFRLLVNVSFLFSISLFATNSFSQSLPNDGCTMDYWKRNTEIWDQATDRLPASVGTALEYFNIPHPWNAVTTELYGKVFNITPEQMSAAGLKNSLTLFQAIQYGAKGFSRLARQSVAALLNAGSGYFPYSVNRVITLTHDAFLYDDPDTPASLFETANNGNCLHWPEVIQPAEIQGPIIVCPQTHPLTYTATFDASYGPRNYKWSLKNNTAGAMLSGSKAGVTTNNSLSINVAPLNDFIAGGQFAIELALSNGGSTEIASTYLAVLPANNPGIHAVAYPEYLINTNIVQLSAIVPCNVSYTYQWEVTPPAGVSYPPFATISNSTSPTTTAIVNVYGFFFGEVTFTLRVTDPNGTITTAIAKVIIPTGGGRPINTDRISVSGIPQELTSFNGNNPDALISPQQRKDHLEINKKPDNITAGILIYPNPAKDVFNIQNSKGILDVSLINMLGETVQRWNSVRSQKIELQAHKPGIYTVLIYEHSTGKQVSKKVLIRE